MIMVGKHGALVKLRGIFLHRAPFVTLIFHNSKRHIQLEGLERMGNDREAILTGDEGEGTTVAPVHVN